MKTIEQMLRHLARADVAEFAMATGRLPCIKVDGAFKPVDESAPTTDQILQMLVAVGGSRYVDALGAKPVQWTTRVDGVGAIAVAAVMRDDKVQARFVVAKREDGEAPSSRRGEVPAAVSRTPSTVARGGAPLATSKTPSTASRTPSTVSKTPSTVSRTPSTASKTPSTLGKTPSRGGRAPSVRPPRPPSVRPPRTPSGRRVPEEEPTMSRGVEAMRMVDLDVEESPTRPGFALELDLERAVAAATVGTERPQGTVRDLDLDLDGSGEPARPPASSRPTMPGEGASLDEMLGAARAAAASDLHVVAERPLLFRIAGDLVPRGERLAAASVEEAVMSRVPMRCRGTLERDGSCDFALDHPRHGRFRVNVTRQRTGLKACLRLVPREVPTLASLGLPEDIGKATHHHQGLIVLTGPTGHGKTSTLAAVVDIINRETTHHIITVEDPVEYVHPRRKAMMSQREVGTHTLSFQNALKASLREDPDVIVVGELRDTETVRMALSASETGHLVLGTMNTPSAAKTIDRLIDLFPPADQAQVRMTLAGGLRLIVSQRLLPAVDGKAMVAAAELLPGSIALWSLIRDAKTFQIPSLQQRGKGFGIIRLDDSLADLVRAGKVTKDAALAVAESPDELDAVLSGKRAPAASAPEMTKEGRAGAGILQKAGSIFGKKGG